MGATVKINKTGKEKTLSASSARVLVKLGRAEYMTRDIQTAPRRTVLTPQKAAPLRQDGPTLEEYVAAGYSAESYPPEGYAPKESLTPQVEDLLGEGEGAPALSLDEMDLAQLHAHAASLGIKLHPQTGEKKVRAAILANAK